MRKLVQEKAKAIELRKKGLSYKEILKIVPVAKSSLSLWLKDLPLTPTERRALKKRTHTNITHGRIKAAAANRTNRIDRNNAICVAAKKEFALYSTDTLFHTGIALYWAEGAKRSNQFLFVNSDSAMIQMMLLWLEKYTIYTRYDVWFRLYVHAPYQNADLQTWWKNQLGVEAKQFKRTILKPTSSGVKKRPEYKGCLRIEVPKSAALLVKTKFWINEIVEYQRKQ